MSFALGHHNPILDAGKKCVRSGKNFPTYLNSPSVRWTSPTGTSCFALTGFCLLSNTSFIQEKNIEISANMKAKRTYYPCDIGRLKQRCWNRTLKVIMSYALNAGINGIWASVWLSRPKLHRGITPMSEIKNFSSLDLLRIFAHHLIIRLNAKLRSHKKEQHTKHCSLIVHHIVTTGRPNNINIVWMISPTETKGNTFDYFRHLNG